MAPGDGATGGTRSDRIGIILAEYNALRAELMYFIAQQRRKMALLTTAAVGQIGFLSLSESILSETASLPPTVLVALYLFVFPTVIFLIFAAALENTVRIIAVADYIHKGIKPQLIQAMGEDGFFEWEEHKGQSLRLSPALTLFMDLSKWFVFAGGIVLSYCLALWVAFNADITPYPQMMFIGGAALCMVYLVVCVLSGLRFNEAAGETTYAPD